MTPSVMRSFLCFVPFVAELFFQSGNLFADQRNGFDIFRQRLCTVLVLGRKAEVGDLPEFLIRRAQAHFLCPKLQPQNRQIGCVSEFLRRRVGNLPRLFLKFLPCHCAFPPV